MKGRNQFRLDEKIKKIIQCRTELFSKTNQNQEVTKAQLHFKVCLKFNLGNQNSKVNKLLFFNYSFCGLSK